MQLPKGATASQSLHLIGEIKMTQTKQVTVKKVTLTRGTEGEWFSGGVCAGSRQVASWGFLQLVTESDTAWVEKEGGGERLMPGPPSCPTKPTFHMPLPLPISTAIYAASREAASSGHSQGTEAWALRNICGCLIAEVGWISLFYIGVWTVPHSLYPGELLHFHYWQCCIDPWYSECGPRISISGLWEMKYFQSKTYWIRICILTRAWVTCMHVEM